ncbi:MAG: hypothetical protein V4549_18210 [Bacteroidota bacterium]
MIITNQTQKQMGQFELQKSKSGISKQIHIDHSVITNDNLTDEKAINILRKCPAHIATFSRYPANWKELVSGVPAEKYETVDQFQQEIKAKKSTFTESKPKIKNKK